MTAAKLNIPFGIVKLDSLRVLIPAEEVTNNSPVNKAVQLFDNETGSFFSEVFQKNAMAFNHRGCTIRIALTSQTRGRTHEGDAIMLNVWAISITAKMISKYFDGITRDNIHECYEYTQSMEEGLKFSYDSFLRGMITDTDYAIDFPINPEELNEIGNYVKRATKPDLISYFNQFKQKNNIGFEFNKREKATPGKPFVKIYHKTLEIRNKNEAWSRSLKDLPQIARLETTIKNGKFWKGAGMEMPKTLNELLSVNSQQIKEYTMGVIDRNYTGRIDKIKPMTRATGDQWKNELLRELIKEILDSNGEHVGTAILKKKLENLKEAGYSRPTLMRARDFINGNKTAESPKIEFDKNSNVEAMLKALNLIR